MESIFAQKFGYVDTQYILQKMPEYKDAQAEIRYYAQAIKALVESDESFSFIMDVCLDGY